MLFLICYSIACTLVKLLFHVVCFLTSTSYNKRQLSRIYPKGTRVASDNYMPQVSSESESHQQIDPMLQSLLLFSNRSQMTSKRGKNKKCLLQSITKQVRDNMKSICVT